MLFFALAAAVLTVGPGRQPQLDARDNLVVLTYGTGNEIWFAGSGDSGRSFAKPVRVGAVEKLMLGRHRGPRVAIAGDSIVVTGISGDGSLLAWRSADRGKTWSPPQTINSVAGAAREGLNGLSANASGTVFATWLDDRGGPKTLYGALSKDGGVHWSENFAVYSSPDGHICECCHPSAVVGANGDLYAMWRNWLNGSRDLWLGISGDGGRSFRTEKLGRGTWPINACPMDGGDLVLDGKGVVHTVWRREKTVYAAEPGGPEREVGRGIDPDLSSSGAIVWASEGRVLIRAGTDAAPVTLAEKGAFPVVSGAVAAWESEGQVMVASVP